MKTEYFTYLSVNGETPIEYTLWTPDHEPKAIIQLVHGMSEHVGRYERFAQFMVEHGFAVCGNNHLGHGREVENNIRGYFGENGAYQYLVEDVKQLTLLIKENFGELPIILMGHSMGSFIARLYMTKYSHLLDGVMISGTSGSNFQAEFPVYYYIKLLAMLKGETTVDLWVDKMICEGFSSRYKNESSNAWLTTVTTEQEKAKKDPLMGFPFTLGGYRELMGMMRLIGSKKWASSIQTKLPILLFSGAKDPVGQYGKGVAEVATRLMEAGQEDVTLLLYPEGRHEMLKEANYMEVQEDILHWVTSILPKNS